jgi:integrase
MRPRKPKGWPSYMTEKKLAHGQIAYYWQPPTWARKGGCPVVPEPLGTDYGEAKRRCDDVLNPQFHAWRTNGEIDEHSRPLPYTFDWLVSVYKSSPKYSRLSPGTQGDYDRVLSLVSKHKIKDGRHFGELTLRSITPGAADRLHARLVEGGAGNRHRTAKLAMDVCRRAWSVAHRDKPTAVPTENPFAQMGLCYRPKVTRAATYEELEAFVHAADALGYRSIGTAALIAFFWLQREEDIFQRLAWNQYRPGDNPSIVRIFHHKTGELVEVPLKDEDGSCLWPDLVPRLDSEPRVGTLLVMRDKPDKKKKAHLTWATSASNPVRHVQRIVVRIREAAKLPSDLTFTSFRHGGHTDAANAGLTDAQIRALSGHKTAAMVSLYAKQTKDQRLAGARMRRDARGTKRDNLSE